MNPQSTDKITQDTAGMQRKIVYRGVIETDFRDGFTATLQEDGVSTFYVGTETVTINELDAGSNYVVDFVVTGKQSVYYQSFKGNYMDGGGSYIQNWIKVSMGNSGGKLKLDFDIKSAFTNIGGTFIYYVVYATKLTDEATI